MIVRDLGDAWQVVLQTDHADLSAAFARAWATPLSPSLVVATERHDDGWAVWEQSPRVDGDGKPVNFLEVDIRVAPRLLPRRDRGDHRAGRRRGAARLDARRRHLPAALRPRPGPRPRPRGGGAGRGGRVRRRAGGEVRRRAGRPPRATTSCSSSSTGSRSTSACATSRAARRPSSRATGSSRSRPWHVRARRRTRSATSPAASRCCAACSRRTAAPTCSARARRRRPRSTRSTVELVVPSPCPGPRRASAPASITTADAPLEPEQLVELRPARLRRQVALFDLAS